MIKESLTKFMERKLDELGALFSAKHKQYSTSSDELANFRTGARLRTGGDDYRDMYEEAKAYQRKHIAYITNAPIGDKHITESLQDIAVYCLIMMYIVEQNNIVPDTIKCLKSDSDRTN
jgi:hypothetical protein